MAVIRHPSYPATDYALTKTRKGILRGNTFGQSHAFNKISDAEREVAQNFDAAEELKKARQQRREAGLS